MASSIIMIISFKMSLLHCNGSGGSEKGSGFVLSLGGGSVLLETYRFPGVDPMVK